MHRAFESECADNIYLKVTAMSEHASNGTVEADDDDTLLGDAKRLLRLAVRTFYPDECVMVVDALLREARKMRGEEIANTVKELSAKDVEKTLRLLVAERVLASDLAEEQKARGSGTAASELYTVDLADFINVLRFRLHKLALSAAQGEAQLSLFAICCAPALVLPHAVLCVCVCVCF